MSAAPKLQFRDVLRSIVPSWLQDRGSAALSVGFRLLWSFGVVLDGLLEGLVQGVTAAFPGLGTPTALPLLGRSRGLRRGLAETDASYGERLRFWRRAHRQKGHPFEILRQIRHYLGPVRCRTVDFSGNWHTIAEDGTENWLQLPGSWNWHSGWTTGWCRFWVIIYPPASWEVWPSFYELDPTLWGGNLAGNGWTLGQQIPFSIAEDIRGIVREWKPAHVSVVNIIIAFDPASFDPADAGTLPDGEWLYYTKGSPKEPARFTTARYWAGVE